MRKMGIEFRILDEMNVLMTLAKAGKCFLQLLYEVSVCISYKKKSKHGISIF